VLRNEEKVVISKLFVVKRVEDVGHYSVLLEFLCSL